MYASFFGFKEKPFNLTPDPRYLYLSPGHREALAHLVYGIQEKQGFIVITGEVGTGKTTLLHTLLEQHDNRVTAAFVFYPKLSFHDFLFYVLDNFGLETESLSTAQCLMHLHGFLIAQHNEGKTTLLVIDEAQNLPIALLEEIRMLSNLETTGEKLLQIALVGQPELQRKLRSQRLRQLRQRIGMDYEIRPLSAAETQDYIRHRCMVAGGEAHTVFTRRALKAIHAHSGGIPRLINTVCERALLTGYAEERRRINRKIVRQVVRDIEARPRHSVLLPSARRLAAVLVGLLLLSIVLYTTRGLSSLIPVFPQLQAPLLQLQRMLPVPSKHSPLRISAPNANPGDSQPLQGLVLPVQYAELPEKRTEIQPHLEDESQAVIIPERITDNTSRLDVDTSIKVRNGNFNETSMQQKNVLPVTRTLKEGDYVSKYAMEIYGYSSNALTTWLHKHNPHIKDIERVKVGETLVFPVLDTPIQ